MRKPVGALLVLAGCAWSVAEDAASKAQTTQTPHAREIEGDLSAFVYDRSCAGPSMVYFSSGTAADTDEAEGLQGFHASSQEVTGLACLATVSCQRWPHVCAEHNIRKTPAVLLYPWGKEPVRFFRGHHTQEAFTAAVARLISVDDRTKHLSAQNHSAFLQEKLHPIKVILFSRRERAPVIFKALSSDSELWPHISFGFVPESQKTLLSQYQVTTVPSVVIQSGSDSGSSYEFYDSTNITFPALRAWLQKKMSSMWLGPIAQTDESQEILADDEEEEEDEEAAAGEAGSSGYMKLAPGTKACPPGLEITSVSECQKAILELGLRPDPSWVSNFPGLPSKCSIREETSGEHAETMHFNSFEGGQGREDLSPVCKKPPQAVKAQPQAEAKTMKMPIAFAGGGSELPDLEELVQAVGGGMEEMKELLRKVTGQVVKTAVESSDVEYMMIQKGASGCPAGHEILSPEECQKAIESLGLRPAPAWQDSYPGLPMLCSIRENPSAGSPERMHWNMASSGSGRSDLSPICRKKKRTGKATAETPEISEGSSVSVLPELSASTQAELLAPGDWSLVYLKEGPITPAETNMLLDVQSRFSEKLAEQSISMRWMWLDLRAERAMKSLLDPPALPSALVLKAGSNAKYVLAQHEEADEEPVPIRESGINLLLNTVLGGDARFTRIAGKKLTAAFSQKRN